jgi:adenylate cyclase
MHVVLAQGHFFAGRYDEALAWAERAVREQPNFFMGLCVAAASGAFADKPSSARKAMAQLRQLNPALRLSNIRNMLPFHPSEDLGQVMQGLEMAGLPD